MKKIATITFHASYNFGSVLQAYALQEYVKKIIPSSQYEIINLRTNFQKEKYRTPFEKKNIKSIIKRIILIREKKSIQTKNILFEKFINEKLNITKEFNSLDDLKKANFTYDYYISGSDQIWNLKAPDFDWANYLEFVKKGKKISYAASFGPSSQNWSDGQKNRVKENLLKYDNISVREQGSFDNVKNLIGKEPSINIDPTFLLNKDSWRKIISGEKILKEDYILLYDLKQKKETFEIAGKVSKILSLPVVIINGDIKSHIKRNFKHYYRCGPCEILNLISNAKLVLSTSFHGNVFSIIFEKPFFSINGLEDFRINTLLNKLKLNDRNMTLENIEQKCNNAYKISYTEANKNVEIEIQKAKEYLLNALDMNGE